MEEGGEQERREKGSQGGCGLRERPVLAWSTGEERVKEMSPTPVLPPGRNGLAACAHCVRQSQVWDFPALFPLSPPKEGLLFRGDYPEKGPSVGISSPYSRQWGWGCQPSTGDLGGEPTEYTTAG